MIKELETIEEISCSSNSKILKVAKKDIYVLKVLNKKNIEHKQIQHFITEYEIMNALNHPNILKSYGFFNGNKEMAASILLEYCPMNLDEAIKKEQLTKVQRACSFYEIASGMKFVHLNKIIHRDIKPSNILISEDGHIKVSDFGISKLFLSDEESLSSGVGSRKFMAPEIINEEKYNEKVDVYSFGVLIYFIISNGEMPKITITQIGIGKKAPIPNDFTEFAKQLINSCWNFNPEQRPSFEYICAQLDDKADELLDLTQSETYRVNNK